MSFFVFLNKLSYIDIVEGRKEIRPKGGVHMRKQLKMELQKRVERFTSNQIERSDEKITRKQQQLKKQHAEIVRVHGAGKVQSLFYDEPDTVLRYQVHLQYLIKQQDTFFMIEEIENREARFRNGLLVSDDEVKPILAENDVSQLIEEETERLTYTYDRRRAVQYAERWWNEFNPAYNKFTDDCTNFISQCLHAGGIPMWGSPKKAKGWWMRGKSWSYSWTSAHGFYLLLARSGGIRTKKVAYPQELNIGDIICIDFEGTGRFDHSLIVTAKDANGMPLVNAHTTNSRHRYWSYEDSSRYTPNIVYKFFIILDGK